MNSRHEPATRAITYQLPSSAGTVWLGLGPVQLSGLAVTLLLTVGLMLTHAPAPLTVTVAVAGAAVSAWPLAGRTGAQWLPLLTTHAIGSLTSARHWHVHASDLSAATPTPPANYEDAWGGLPAGRPPGRPVRLTAGHSTIQVRPGPGGMAAVQDTRRQTVTIVLATTPTGRFGLLDPGAQDATLQRWGSSLATLLHLPGVRHVQWLVHTGPDTHRPSPEQGDPLRQDQAVLLGAARAQARRHTHLLSLTLASPDPSRRGKGTRQLLDAGHLVAQEAAAALLAADILSYPVNQNELTGLLRHLLDPTHPDPAIDVSAAVCDATEPMPEPVALSGRETWTSCSTDDTLHRAFAVAGWPRTSLRADWLAPLLHQPTEAGTARTLTVQARPVGQAQAARRARAGAAKARLDAADRQRLGFTSGAATALDEADAEQTEAELVAGYRMADMTALLTVHAPTIGLLDVASGQLRTAALTHRLELRPLHGQHQHALAAALPLGIPMAGRR